MNPDKLEPKERCASTSNRNFEGRQGAGGRTHLVSPAMAAAAAVAGCLTDVRKLPVLKPLPPTDDAIFQAMVQAMEAIRPAPSLATRNAAKAKSATSNAAAASAKAGASSRDPSKVFDRLVGVAAKMDIQNIGK